MRRFLLLLALLPIAPALGHAPVVTDSLQLSATVHVVDFDTCIAVYADNALEGLRACGDPPPAPCFSGAGFGDTSC